MLLGSINSKSSVSQVVGHTALLNVINGLIYVN